KQPGDSGKNNPARNCPGTRYHVGDHEPGREHCSARKYVEKGIGVPYRVHQPGNQPEEREPAKLENRSFPGDDLPHKEEDAAGKNCQSAYFAERTTCPAYQQVELPLRDFRSRQSPAGCGTGNLGKECWARQGVGAAFKGEGFAVSKLEDNIADCAGLGPGCHFDGKACKHKGAADERRVEGVVPESAENHLADPDCK